VKFASLQSQTSVLELEQNCCLTLVLHHPNFPFLFHRSKLPEVVDKTTRKKDIKERQLIRHLPQPLVNKRNRTTRQEKKLQTFVQQKSEEKQQEDNTTTTTTTIRGRVKND